MAVETGAALEGEATALRVRLLGGFDLRLGGAPVGPLASRRAESLLAYLLLHRDAPQPRQHLAFLLWPDSTESQARTNLRHVLHTLRQAMPEADRFLDVRPGTLRWRSEAPMSLDVATFEQAVSDGRLEDAVEAYTGDLLPGRYDEWLLEERARLAQRHLDALERLVTRLEEQRRWPEAIRHAERLVRQDPLREEVYRLLMRLCDASGDRARALRVYHVCATTLQREWGVEPAAPTRAVYEALLDDGAGRPAEKPPSPGRPPFVGRAAERAKLIACWRAAAAGSAQLVLVTGEAGIGKSRLVDELRAWCAHAGAVTAEARAYPAEGAMAYGLVVSWLRSEAVGGRLRGTDSSVLTELARLLPELLDEIPDLPAPEPLPESEQRQRLFGALERAILDAGAPLLLVADDLQWADVETLRFLHYVLRARPSPRLLVAATARREEIDPDHPANRFVAALQARGRVTEVPLERLSREETGALAGRVASRSLPAMEIDRLHADSEGNPLFVVEALRADGGAAPGPGAGSRVQAVIASRLAQLSEPAAELAGVAATIGREFTVEVLAGAGVLGEAAFVRALDELWRRGVVRAQGPSAYDFSHGRIREVAYRRLSPPQRRHHHLRVARVLESGHPGSVDAVSGQIAAHYDAAGAAADGIAWYERAAKAAQRLHASADAVRFLERARELVGRLPDGPERVAAELRLLTALPAPLVAVEGYLSRRVGEVHERAVDLAAALDVEPDAPLVRSLALAALTRGDFEGARPFGERLRARADREGDDVLWVESAYVLGVAAFWQGQLDAARGRFQAAVDRCRPEHRGTHLVRYGQDPEAFCGLRLAYTLWLLGRDGEAEHRRDAALARAERSGHPFTLAATTAWAALLALDQRDERQLRRRIRALTAGEAAFEARPVRAFTQALLGYVAVLDGHPRAGIERVRRELDDVLGGEPVAPGQPAMHARILLEACAKAGDARTGLAVTDEALRMGGGTQLWEAEIRRLRAGFLWALGGRSDTVGSELARALEVAGRQGARAFERRVGESLDRFRAGRL